MKTTRLASLIISYTLTAFSLSACGKSPWSDYVKENNLHAADLNKPTSSCPILNFNQLQWLQGPSVNSESQFHMTFLQPVSFNLKVDLFMPDMGHGSSPVEITAEDSQNFMVKRVFFIMHGLWEVRLFNDNNILCKFEINLP
jgi:hypothetical protein